MDISSIFLINSDWFLGGMWESNIPQRLDSIYNLMILTAPDYLLLNPSTKDQDMSDM